jgi:hypothetical protein
MSKFNSEFLGLETPSDGEQGDYVFKPGVTGIWLRIDGILLHIYKPYGVQNGGVVVEQHTDDKHIAAAVINSAYFDFD